MDCRIPQPQGADSIKVNDKSHPRTVYEVPKVE